MRLAKNKAHEDVCGISKGLQHTAKLPLEVQ